MSTDQQTRTIWDVWCKFSPWNFYTPSWAEQSPTRMATMAWSLHPAPPPCHKLTFLYALVLFDLPHLTPHFYCYIYRRIHRYSHRRGWHKDGCVCTQCEHSQLVCQAFEGEMNKELETAMLEGDGKEGHEMVFRNKRKDGLEKWCSRAI